MSFKSSYLAFSAAGTENAATSPGLTSSGAFSLSNLPGQ